MSARLAAGLPMRTYTIGCEQDVWAVLTQCVNDASAMHETRLIFEGWPTQEVIFDSGDGTITPEIGRAMRLQQIALNRAYAQLKYGSPNSRRLTRTERRSISIPYRVTEGSTKIFAQMGKALTAFARAAPARMSGREAAIAVVGIAACLGGSACLGLWIWKTAETHQEAIRAAGQHELVFAVRDLTTAVKNLVETNVEQAKLIGKATQIDISGTLPLFISDQTSWRAAYLDAPSDASRITWNGVVLPAPAAKKIVKEARKTSAIARTEARRSGTARVIETGWTATVHPSRELSPPMRLGKRTA